jgi:hypothetical protein
VSLINRGKWVYWAAVFTAISTSIAGHSIGWLLLQLFSAFILKRKYTIHYTCSEWTKQYIALENIKRSLPAAKGALLSVFCLFHQQGWKKRQNNPQAVNLKLISVIILFFWLQSIQLCALLARECVKSLASERKFAIIGKLLSAAQHTQLHSSLPFHLVGDAKRKHPCKLIDVKIRFWLYKFATNTCTQFVS